jgi:hypothetical protein
VEAIQRARGVGMKTVYENIISHPGTPKILKDALDKAFIINADNVAEYFFSANEKDEWDIRTDFPNIAPPFETFFIEYRMPSEMLLPGGVITPITPGIRMGILFSAYDFSKDKKYEKFYHDGIRWQMIAALFLENNGKLLFYDNHPILQSWMICVRENGEVYSTGDKDEDIFFSLNISQNYIDSLSEDAKSVYLKEGRNHMRASFDIALLAISFMHCKNVKSLPVLPKKSPGKRNKHGPHITYHVLEIAPMKKILQTEGNSEKTGIKKALHICRGHFKTFENHGLFGKYIGTYWWDSHTRGNISAGITEKDYSINLETGAPKQVS